MSSRPSRAGVATSVRQPLRFVRGLRAFVRTPLDPSTIDRRVLDEHRQRDRRFLDTLDQLVWPVAGSPWRRFFQHVGAEPADVRQMVAERGLDGALAHLRDLGVYLTTEEATGEHPVRRGSTTFAVRPDELFNPIVTADFIAGTSGTRSTGTPVAASFLALRRMAVNLELTAALWEVSGRPHALWRPALPGSGGLIALLSSSVTGRPPERWFSQLDPRAPGVAASKRLANTVLPLAAWPTPLPRPVHVPTTLPTPVLAWCRDALQRAGRAALNVYPSSALRLAECAHEAEVSLEGLVLRLVGEPVTASKADRLRRSGASPVNAYAFAQQGAVATACPHDPDESLHLFEHEVAVVPRPRLRPDGAPVQAFLWTSLSPHARSVWINVENDDYGMVRHDESPCDCRLGAMGMRTRLVGIRGMSKAVTGGVTVPAGVVDQLVDEVLPAHFGGGPGDWQLAEAETTGAGGGGSHLEVRVDPRLGLLDAGEVARVVLATLERTETGVLASSVWSAPGFIRVVRRSPEAARSGKTLPFETLPSATEAVE